MLVILLPLMLCRSASTDICLCRYEHCRRGDSQEDHTLNAKYLISCARKMGACVFLTPEDVVEVQSKMVMTFCAEVWAAHLRREDYESGFSSKTDNTDSSKA